MERLILDMMGGGCIGEGTVRKGGNNPITWNIPTEILYAGNDTLISRQTVDMFVSSYLEIGRKEAAR